MSGAAAAEPAYFIACQKADGEELYTSAIASREELDRSIAVMRRHPLFLNGAVRAAGVWRVTARREGQA